MALLTRVAGAWARQRLRVMRRRAAAPARTQERLLARWLKTARGTEFGVVHGFRRIRCVEDFRRRVPLADYARMAPWWDRARAGEAGLTWPGPVATFGLSSGTTAGEKYLPLTEATLRTNARGGLDALAVHLAQGGADALEGRLLFLGGATALRVEDGVAVGDHTGILARRMPAWVRRLHTPSPEVAALASWDAKIPRAAAEALREDVRVLAGIPSWLLLFADEVRSQAARAGRPHATLSDVWPRLGAVLHGGTAFAPYRERLLEVLGPGAPGRGIRLVETYSATEGGMLAVEDVPGALLPILDRSAYLEFVPVGDLGDAVPRRLGLEATEPGVEYALAVTTNAGQWAYLLGDIVRPVATHPWRLVFAGRTAQMMNGFGEHVSGGEIDRAVSIAGSSLGLRVGEYAVAARYPEDGDAHGRHVYFVELEAGATDLDRFARIVDATVAGGNDDYRAHRAGGYGLALPEIVPLPPGTFYAWMRAEGRLGGQNKVPRVLGPARHAALAAFLGTVPAPVAVPGGPR